MTAVPAAPASLAGEWQPRLELIVETMREMSVQTDPQAMVSAYRERMRQLNLSDGMVALSRRDLPAPKFRITRSTLWQEEINPWTQVHRLPVLEGGLLGELIYADRPHVIDELLVDPHDPGADHLAGYRSLVAIPLFDQGTSLNMVALLRRTPNAFRRESLPELVWQANLFGRATYNLVLRHELKQAYDQVEHELNVVADIQRSLLPARLPSIPSLSLAAHYQTSRYAGGDYYDIFELPNDRWGILIADVSGHGAPAAVLMAVTHSIAHAYAGPPTTPGRLLGFINHHLCARYTNGTPMFVTAFYGVYDARSHELHYACAGHNPPRLKRAGCASVVSLDGAGNLPLGIEPCESYGEAFQKLQPGDQVVFYTDGITEAQNPAGEQFEVERLDQVLGGCRSASEVIASVLDALGRFTAGRPAADDRTLLVATVACE